MTILQRIALTFVLSVLSGVSAGGIYWLLIGKPAVKRSEVLAASLRMYGVKRYPYDEDVDIEKKGEEEES